jgi:isopenicillin N synthase-like dioxygenase
VVQKVLRLLAIVLELPDENQLAKPYDFTGKGEDILRYLKYDAIPIEDSEANDGIYTAKHTDLGTLTLNFCQPIAGLQILDTVDGEWKWVRPWEADEIVVNCGDALSAITGGYFKSGQHRVHAPPKEQIHLDRFGALYFSRYALVPPGLS